MPEVRMPIKHEMKLQPEPFEKIRSGQKRIEIRLNDQKRQKLQIGDQIDFYKLPEMKDILHAKVTNLFYFKSFAELTNSFPIDILGAESAESLLGLLYTFYNKDEEKALGVVGIEIAVLPV